MSVSTIIRTQISPSIAHFLAASEMRERLNEFYLCPICEQVAQLDAIVQELEQSNISSIAKLACSHRVPLVVLKYPLVVHSNHHIEMFVSSECKDREGKLYSRLVQRSHSFVQNFLNYMSYSFNYAAFNNLTASGNFNTNSSAIKDTSNTTWYSLGALVTIATTQLYGIGALSLGSASGISTFGLQVGTGTTTPAATDYKLQTLIANGGGAGQLSYGAMTVNVPSLSSNTNTIGFVRTYTNNSGGTISSTEVGIVIAATAGTASGSSNDSSSADMGNPVYILITHDLFAAAQNITNGSSLTVTYQFQTTT